MSPIPLGILAAAGAGAAGGSYELIETYTVGAGGIASVTFDVSSYTNTYQHLQIRAVIRSSRSSGAPNDGLFLRFNNDTAANYSFHSLYGNGSTTGSFGVANTSQGCFAGYFTASNGPANTFGVSVIDILDPFETAKYTTTRSLSGSWTDTTDQRWPMLSSGSWRNTAALSSILFRTENSLNFTQYSRFSIYGLRSS